MKKITIGILAHVDAGKTTLSEALLFHTGEIRTLGRVDHGDAFLDTDAMEKERGITIFSKMARFVYQEEQVEFVLLDTPGHADFTAEMERTLAVLDYAVLLISGTDGVQGHTKTLWRLLHTYQVPCFIFVNKMDISNQSQEQLLLHLKEKLSDNCHSFMGDFADEEGIALCDESLMETYLETGELQPFLLQQAICQRKLFPVFFGSALKLQGVEELLSGMGKWMLHPTFGKNFGARCYKIGRDANGNRLTYLKILGGKLAIKDSISYEVNQEEIVEKINQIRIYRGDKFETVNEVEAGGVCAVTGLSESFAGMTLGEGKPLEVAVIEPVLSYQVIPPQEVAAHTVLGYMRQLEEEDPTLHVVWQEQAKQVHVNLMGPVQTEIIQQQLKERFGVLVTFGTGAVRYKETIEGAVEGVGHFEPLRHYAEAHVLIEALPQGSGMEYAMDCSTDLLDLNWQRLIYTHLSERTHRGVLTGSPLTDVRLTVVSGRAHKKHTEGGDFRQATYRAVRQGLRKAKSVLLEPFYQVVLEVPQAQVGRAMTDVSRMAGVFDAPVIEGDMAVLTGRAPVSLLRDYGVELATYTGGLGRMTLEFAGYYPCHNPEEVIEEMGYQPDLDVRNTCDSVFCAHGAGYIVPWYEVEEHMHMPYASALYEKEEEPDDMILIAQAKREAMQRREEAQANSKPGSGVGGLEKDLEEIFVREFGEIKRRLPSEEKRHVDFDKARRVEKAREDYENSHSKKERKTSPAKKKFFLVDGYNVIFAWEELRQIAAVNLDGARGRLIDIMCNYQGHIGEELIVVFDAYRLQGHKQEVIQYHNISLVYTKEAETADAFIERTTHEMAKEHQVTVATSDRLEQMIVIGEGARRMSARELEEDVKRVNDLAMESFKNKV